MAPKSTSKPPSAAERRAAARNLKLPERLTPNKLLLCYVGIPLALVAFAYGVFGVLVLRDPDQQEWYSNTRAAELWRTLINKNPFYLTIAVNGGMVTAIFLGKLLFEHRQAVKLERKLQARKRERDAQQEAKKEK